MTFEELEEYVRAVKGEKQLPCNLFDERLKPGSYPDAGLYVEKNSDVWEVYQCERGSKGLLAVFYTQSDCYEYIYSCYKQIADFRYWPWWYTLILLVLLALPWVSQFAWEVLIWIIEKF